MIGQRTISIDAKDFIKGMTSSDNITDGGFSNQTYGVNLTSTPGALSFSAQTTDASTNLVGNMLASAPNDTTASGVDLFFLARNSSNSDGTYYWWNGSALTIKRTDSTNNYAFGKNDIITFQNEIYATSNEQLIRWTADDVTFNASFFTFTSSVAPHPALLFEQNVFYGDANILLRQTAANSAPSAILTLPTGQVITALGIDPGSGRMLISVSEQNVSGTLPATNKVLYYDGYSGKALKVVIVDDMITAFYNVGSTMYVTYGQTLGYWNGAGIKFLRALNITLSNDTLAYRNHITNIGNNLYVIESRKILVFGDIVGRSNSSFWYLYRNSSQNLSLITNLGQNKIGIGTLTDTSFFTLDTSTTGANADFWSVRYNFERPVTFNQIVIEYVSAIPTSGTTGNVYVLDDKGATTNIATIVNTTASVYTVECPWPSIETRMIQMDYSPSQNQVIRRFTIFFTPKD